MGVGDDFNEWEEELEKGIEEGAEQGAEKVRLEMGVPEEAQARKKWFLTQGNTKKWRWNEGMVYGADFFNPYLDFNGIFRSDSVIRSQFPCSFLLFWLKRGEVSSLTPENHKRIFPQTPRLLALNPEISNRRRLPPVSILSLPFAAPLYPGSKT